VIAGDDLADVRITTRRAAAAVARTLHARAVRSRRVATIARVMADIIPADARVLDIGCGDGRVAAEMVQLRPDVTATGIDVLVQPETFIPVTAYDGSRLPFVDASIDVTMIVDVVHHAPDPLAFLADVARVTRRAIVIKDHLRDGVLAGPTLRAMDWLSNAPHGIALAYKYLSRREWDDAFARVGLRVDAWRAPLGLYPRPGAWVFERGLHFAARLVPVARAD